MSLEDLKTEMSELPGDQQDHLAAYLVHLRHQRDSAIRREITSRVDDKSSGRWVSLEELKEKWKD